MSDYPPIIQHNAADAATKLASSYLSDLKDGALGLDRYENHIRATSEYTRLLEIAHKAKRHLSSIGGDEQAIMRYEIEEAEIGVEMAYAALYNRFNILPEVKREQERRVAKVANRLVDLIKEYNANLGIVWPGGCDRLGEIHRFLGNPEQAAASYRAGLDAIRSAKNPASFNSIEIDILRALDDTHYSVTTAPHMELDELRPQLKKFVNNDLKQKGIYWCVGGVVTLACMGLGIIPLVVGIILIVTATTNGISTYGNVNAKRIN